MADVLRGASEGVLATPLPVPRAHLAQRLRGPRARGAVAEADDVSPDDLAAVAEHLDQRLEELDRRERALAERWTQLERECTAWRWKVRQAAVDLYEQQQTLAGREAGAADREQDEGRREQQLVQQARELAEERAAFEELRETLRTDLTRELDAGRAELQSSFAALQRQQDELDAAAARLRADFDAERDSLHSKARELEAAERHQAEELAALRDAELHAMAEERARHEADIAALLRDRQVELDDRAAQLQQRGIDLEKRSQFLEMHLARTREALELRQRDIKLLAARQRAWTEQVEASVRMRLSHLRRYRSLMDQREQLNEQGWDALARQQHEHEQAVLRDREECAADRRAVAEQRQADAAHLARREDLLRLREQDGERRRARQDRTAEELAAARAELAHREACIIAAAQALEGLVPPQELDAIVSRMHAAMASHPPHTPSDGQHNGSDLADLEQSLRASQQSLSREREAAGEALAAREERLRLREEAVARQAQQSLVRRHKELDAAREADGARREAEALLRDLLNHVEALVAGGGRPVPEFSLE